MQFDFDFKKPRRGRKTKVLPPPGYSQCCYVRLDPKFVAMFKFLLEAEDNLGYVSVVDRWKAVLKVVFSPHQMAEMRTWLLGARGSLDFEVIDLRGLWSKETSHV